MRLFYIIERKAIIYSIMASSTKDFVYLSVYLSFGNYRQMNRIESLAPALRSVSLPRFVLFHNMLNDYFWRARTVHTSIRLMDNLEETRKEDR